MYSSESLVTRSILSFDWYTARARVDQCTLRSWKWKPQEVKTCQFLFVSLFCFVLFWFLIFFFFFFFFWNCSFVLLENLNVPPHKYCWFNEWIKTFEKYETGSITYENVAVESRQFVTTKMLLYNNIKILCTAKVYFISLSFLVGE